MPHRIFIKHNQLLQQQPRKNSAKARAARWYILKPNIKIWINFGRPSNGKFCYILWPCEIYYGPLVYFIAIWKFSGNLVYFPRFGILHKEKSGNPELLS
jgi:hypothetical protein